MTNSLWTKAWNTKFNGSGNKAFLSMKPVTVFPLWGNIGFVCVFNGQVATTQNSGPKNDEKEKLRRQKQGRRLQEINARRREEKVLR